MKTAFVTGATGFLGRHLVDVLTEAGFSVTALVRDEARARALLGSKATYVFGDMTKAADMTLVIPEGVDAVFHVAADTSTWRREAVRQQEVNVTGTKALLAASAVKGAKRFIHVSSFAVYGIHEDVITEQSVQNGKGHWAHYVRTKWEAEDAVHAAIGDGLDGVIVNPAHIVGRYDDHNWARLIQFVDKGTLPGIPPGSGNFANGRKVAEAMLKAFEVGRTGENYILAGPKETFTTFMTLVAEKLGKPLTAPKRPAWVLKTLAVLLDLFVDRLSGKRPLLTPEEAYFSCEDMVASSAKAVKDLEYEEVPLSESLDEAIAYLRASGKIL